MTLLAPAFMWAAVVIAAAVVALHLIVTHQPRAYVLPTTRFVPDSRAVATARRARPADLLLLLLRVTVILALGAGLARPTLESSRRETARVILADVSRDMRSLSEVIDSVASLRQDGDTVLLYDAVPRGVGSAPLDSSAIGAPTSAAARLSPVLIQAIRAGSALRDRADSLELVIVSPLAAGAWDAATDSIRSLWPGRARLIAVAMREPGLPLPDAGVEIRSPPDDPLFATVGLLAAEGQPTRTRIVRDAANVEDSGWVASGSAARTLVIWPVAGRPPGTLPGDTADESGAVIGERTSVIARFTRPWSFDPDSIRLARVIARWADGEAAVVEWRAGSSCTRSVAIGVPVAGDLAIRHEFVRLVGEIAGACAPVEAPVRLAERELSVLRGSGDLAARAGFSPAADSTSPFTPWLLALALFASLLELLARRQSEVRSRAAVDPSPATPDSSEPERRLRDSA